MGGRVVGLVLHQHVPHLVAAVGPGNVAHHASMHDHLGHGRAADEGAIGGLLHRHHLPAPVEAVSADEHLRLAVLQPGRDRLGAVAGEEGDDHGADLGRRQHRDGHLGAHRHEDADPIAGPDAQPPQRAREAADLYVELAVGEAPHVARLALPDERELVVELTVAVAVEAALDDVHARADPPLRPLLAGGEVDHAVVVAVEGDVDVLDGCVPEPLDVLVRAPQQLGERLDAVLVHEALQPALGDHLGTRLPDHVPDHDRLHGLWILEGCVRTLRRDAAPAARLCRGPRTGHRAVSSRRGSGDHRGRERAGRRRPTHLPGPLRATSPCVRQADHARGAAELSCGFWEITPATRPLISSASR